MEWAEELFTLKRSAKKGRRAAAENTENSPRESNPEKPNSGTSLNALVDSFDEDLEISSVSKPRKTGVWSDDPIKTSGKSRAVLSNLIEQERMQHPRMPSQLDDEHITVIPDIEDLQEDLPLDEMMEAHQESANRSSTHNTLNTDVLKQGAFAFLDDIELSILARCLLNERELVEQDDIWTWDKLFTEVSGEIHGEKPKSADTTSQFIH